MHAWRALRLTVLVLGTGLSSGCFIFGGDTTERVEDASIVRFAERIDDFYRSFENTPLDLRSTFEDPERRAYFASEEDFSAYYASLAAEARRALLRNSTAREVVVDEFRFESEGVAVVDVRFIGKHVRRLRMGDVELPRKDTWRLLEDRWVLSPDKL